MAATETDSTMTDEGRALLTPGEREILSGERDVSDNYRYKVESLVRNRIRKKFGEDIGLLKEHFPEIYEMIKEEVCNEEGAGINTR